MLESCLLQWTDFSASHDQVTRWLKDMEKRLRETHLKADLTEKKAELQRCKVREKPSGDSRCPGLDELGQAGVKFCLW